MPRIHAPNSASPVPAAVVERLCLYVRELQRLIRDDIETVSSGDLGRRLGLSAAQVRKDLAYFGNFGQRGIGYRCVDLVERIRAILGTNRHWPVVLVGAGNLGRSLIGYRGFSQQGFQFVAALDTDRQKVQQPFAGIPVFHLDDAALVISRFATRLAVVCVPAEEAQLAVERLVSAGIAGILNFAPVKISGEMPIRIVNVDLAVELEQLSFAVVNQVNNL